MSFLTIILFFMYIWGFGYLATKFVKNNDSYLERNLMRIGIGLGILPIFGILLNLLRIPIDWKIFFIISIVPFLLLFKKFRIASLKFKIQKSDVYIFIVIILFLFTLFMYEKGAFAYDYLEDDDPWHHAQTVKYISTEKTAYELENFNVIYFTDPYPPGYGIIMAILHQTSSSISWTLKFFNALIISLGIIFFYFFVKVFTGNKNKALFSTFVLASIPSYLSHFIWAHAYIVTLFFPAMYCLEKIKDDKRWSYIAAIIISSILIIQPSQAIKLGIMFFLYFLVKSIYYKKIQINILIAEVGGLLLSFLWWYNKFAEMFSFRLSQRGGVSSELSFLPKFISTIKKAFPYDSGTATRAYNFNDFFIAKSQNLINNPIGWGIVITLLLIFSVIYLLFRHRYLFDKKNYWLGITLAWFIFVFLGVNSMTFNLPIGFFAFRFWMLLAIPVSILIGEGFYFITAIFRKNMALKYIIIFVFVFLIIITSARQKYAVNTAMWPPGATWTSYDEVNGYLWLKTLPADTKVFAFTMDRVWYIIGLDKFICVWCRDDMDFRENAINKSSEELHTWLKRNKYEYITIGGKEAMEFGFNKTNEKINELSSSGLFKPAHQTQGVLIFRVV